MIEKDLPGIAKTAGVDMLVSKWEIVYRGIHFLFLVGRGTEATRFANR